MFKFSSNNDSKGGRNNNSRSDNNCRKRNSHTDGPVKCPYCGSDSWFIYSVHFRCFLCGRIFGGKRLLMPSNITKINSDLEQLKFAADEFDNFFNTWYDEQEGVDDDTSISR